VDKKLKKHLLLKLIIQNNIDYYEICENFITISFGGDDRYSYWTLKEHHFESYIILLKTIKDNLNNKYIAEILVIL
jgi:hypothetical protein